MRRYRPSKPAAILSAFVGIGMIAFGLAEMQGDSVPFTLFWCAAVIAISGLNLWAAFSPRGQTSASRDE